jgi:hypothetical protein
VRSGDDPAARTTRDRQVVLVAVAIVAGVLGLNVLSVLVPALGDLLGGVPVLIVGLIAVTLIVLGLALRRR